MLHIFDDTIYLNKINENGIISLTSQEAKVILENASNSSFHLDYIYEDPRNNNTSEMKHIDLRSDINMNYITSNSTSDVVPVDRPDECRVATTHSVTSNTVNMPMLKQFDMIKISGLLCGANINCSTINFNFNSSN